MSPRDIDEMELSEIVAQFNYYKQNPPAHIMLQGFFKMAGDDSSHNSKKPTLDENGEMSEEQFQQIISSVPRMR